MSAVVNVDSPVFALGDVLLRAAAVDVIKVDVTDAPSIVGTTDANGSCTYMCVCVCV